MKKSIPPTRNWQPIRDWREIKKENMIHIVTLQQLTSLEWQIFQLFRQGEITRNY